jgi:hypothetical protein
VVHQSIVCSDVFDPDAVTVDADAPMIAALMGRDISPPPQEPTADELEVATQPAKCDATPSFAAEDDPPTVRRLVPPTPQELGIVHESQPACICSDGAEGAGRYRSFPPVGEVTKPYLLDEIEIYYGSAAEDPEPPVAPPPEPPRQRPAVELSSEFGDITQFELRALCDALALGTIG